MDWATFQIAGIALLSKLITFAVAAVAMYFMMVLYDRTSKVDTDKALDLVEADGRATADYFGWRILAFAVVAGLVFS